MKKILSSLALALLVIAPTVQAKEFNASGYFLATGQFANQLDIIKSDDKPTYKIYERVELAFDLILAESLGGQLKMRLPSNGKGQFGDVNFTTNSIISPEIRSLYAFFPLAKTPITAQLGMQEYMLPGYLGGNVNPVFDQVAPGLVLQAQLGMLEPTFVWFILQYPNDINSNSVENFFALSVNLDLAEHIQAKPWFALNESNSGIMYIGLTSAIDLDNLQTGVDLLYGQKDIAYTPASSLLLDFYASYEMASFTPGIMAWYSTGKRGNNEGISEFNGSWAYFNASSNLLFDNANGLQSPFTPSNTALANPFGTLGLGLSIANLNLSDNTTLSAHALYVKQTDENENNAATEVGISLFYSMMQYVDIFIDTNYYIPMQSTITNEGNGFSLATSMSINF